MTYIHCDSGYWRDGELEQAITLAVAEHKRSGSMIGVQNWDGCWLTVAATKEQVYSHGSWIEYSLFITADGTVALLDSLRNRIVTDQ